MLDADTEVRVNQPSLRLAPRGALAALIVAIAVLLPATAQAASLHVVFPQTAEATVVQGQSSTISLDVQAFGATQCSNTTLPVVVNSLYSINAAGAIAGGDPQLMQITTDQSRGVSDNCDIHNPVLVPLTVTAASDTPVGDYNTVVRYGKGGDGDVDSDGPPLTIHVIAPDAQPVITEPAVEPPPPAIIVLGVRETPRPTLGKTVMLTLVKSKVTYRVPGKSAVVLTGSVIVPNGTRVDATNGVVKVTVVHSKAGGLDSVDAWGGGFIANQNANPNRPITTLQLSGTVSVGSRNVASAARKRHGAKLWVNGKGNFQTRGNRASASVLGTYWLTEETTRGTRISVKRGLIAVRDFARKKTVLVGKGQTYTATQLVARVRRVPAFTGSVRHG
jgi:hypothetical protein